MVRFTWLPVVLGLLISAQASAQDRVQVTFQTVPPSTPQTGHACFGNAFDPTVNIPNVYVVWLQEQGTGRYARTLHRFGYSFLYNLETWMGISDMKVDATSEASPRCHTEQYYRANYPGRCGATCTCGNGAGLMTAPTVLDTGVVDISDLPDGTYEVHFEVSNCETADDYVLTSDSYSSLHAMVLTFDKGSSDDTASDAGAAPFVNVDVTYTADTASNRPPGVEAGADQRVTPSGSPEEATITLDGVVSDDNGAANATWTMVSADPATGVATFANAAVPTTDVSFSRSGIYVLQLAVDDTVNAVVTDQMTVYVNASFLVATDDAPVNPNANNHAKAMGYYSAPNPNPCAPACIPLAQGWANNSDSECNGNACSRAYIRFDISSVTDPVERAFLKLPAAGEEAIASRWHDFHLLVNADDSWGDDTLTWDNQPLTEGNPTASEPVVGSLRHAATLGARTWFLVDLVLAEVFPSGIHSNNTVSLFARPRGDTFLGFALRKNEIKPELVVIEEWDAPATGPFLTLSLAPGQESEGVGTVQATVTANPAPGSDLVLDVTSSDATVTVPPNVTITSGTTQATFDLTIVDDSTDTGDRTALITVSDPGTTYASDNAVFRVIEDDTPFPRVNWQSATQTVSEDDIVVTLTATLSFAPTAPVTADYTVTGTATAGVDHDLSDGTLSFAIDDTEETLVVSLTFDGQPEGDETVIVTLGSPTGAEIGSNDVHTVTITDPVSSDGGVTGGDPGPSSPRGSNIVQGGCGCDATGVTAGWLALAVVLALRRRRV